MRKLVAERDLASVHTASTAINVVRHAQADKTSLAIHFTTGHVSMDIMDNGIGFNAPQGRAEIFPNGHYWVLGLFEHAALIGATLQIKSIPGSGTQVQVI